MKPIRVLHLTWSADKAGLMTEIVKAQADDSDLQLDVCFATLENGIFFETLKELGINPHVLGMQSKYNPVDSLRGGKRLAEILRTNIYDIVHLQEAILPFPFLAATSGYPKTKVIVHNRGEFCLTDHRRQILGQYAKKMVYYLMVGPRVHRVICNSNFTLSHTPLGRRFQSKLVKLYNAVNTKTIRNILTAKAGIRSEKRNELEIDDNAFVVTCAARLVGFKRINLLIDAFSMLLAENVNAICLVAGDGPLKSALVDYATSKGLGDRIRFLGHRKDAKEILASSDASVLPSFGEAFGNVVLEAVSLGIPTLVFEDAGGPLEFIKPNINGYVVNDVHCLKDKLLELYTNGNHYQPDNDFLDEFDIKRYAEGLKRMYFDLLGD